ncbi:Fic family protein [Salarchaeum sp. III]|uniref:Fic family protein n=1 Tax=Salarchaeum sp. III TaxID=3107927 RepID=UPI002ED82EE9
MERLPSVDEVHTNHDEIVAEFDLDNAGVDGFFPDEKIREVIADARDEPTISKRAAALLCGLPSLHVYEDGNKRTAWLTVVEFLDRHGREPAEVDPETVEVVMKSISRYNVSEIAQWLSNGTIDTERLVSAEPEN